MAASSARLVWVDAQISPAVANWLREAYGVQAFALRDIGLRDAEDREIFHKARAVNAVVLTKDRDFVDLLGRFGPPPQVLWLTCGNTSTAMVRALLTAVWSRAEALLRAGEPLIEIGGE